MRSFFIIAALMGTNAAASPAVRSPTDPSIVHTGDVPTCVVSGGHTIVNYSPSFHTNFKCAHTGATCACTLHPTHKKGGCQEIVGTNGVSVQHAGDCTESGQDVTPAPTPAPWSGPAIAEHVEVVIGLGGDQVLNIGAGTFDWSKEVLCNRAGTLTLIGQGKDNTILDAKGKVRHITLVRDGGCRLVLKDLTLQNGWVNMETEGRPRGTPGYREHGGAVQVLRGCHITATNVKFHKNEGKNGGAVYIANQREYPEYSSTPTTGTFVNCDFTENIGHTGGAVCSYATGLTFTDCKFIKNRSSYAAAVFHREQEGHTAFWTRCLFDGNVGQYGGALQCLGQNEICDFHDCTFTNNHGCSQGKGNGGVLNCSYGGKCTFTGSNTYNNNKCTNTRDDPSWVANDVWQAQGQVIGVPAAHCLGYAGQPC